MNLENISKQQLFREITELMQPLSIGGIKL